MKEKMIQTQRGDCVEVFNIQWREEEKPVEKVWKNLSIVKIKTIIKHHRAV